MAQMDTLRFSARPLLLLRGTLLLVGMLLLVGCSATVRKPKLFHPGPAGYQRYNATQFDPYPPNDMGPAIVGGRPVDYMQPPPEVVRARQQQPIGPWRSRSTR